MAEIMLTVEENDVTVDMEIDETQEVEVIETDHTKLTNRDAEDQHPKKAITGLVEDLKALADTDKTQGEAIAALEEKIMRPMTAAEAEEILNGRHESN